MKLSMRRRLVAALAAVAVAIPLGAGVSPLNPARAQGGLAGPGSMSTTTSFSEGGGDPAHPYVSFFIAGILAVNDDLVYSWTDARYAEPDGSPSDAVLRRSTDGGVTWGPIIVMGSGLVGGVPTLNVTTPTMVRDRVGGRLSYFYSVRGDVTNPSDTEHSAIYVRTSTDDGYTFGPPVLVSDVLETADAAMQAAITAGTAPPQFAGERPELYAREYFLPTPGLPIQLSANYPNWGNRLVVAIFAIKRRTSEAVPVNSADRGYGNMTLVSDDGGLTWQAGGIVPIGAYASNEASIVETQDNRIVLNARIARFDSTRRSVTRSASGGNNWLAPQLVDTSVISPYFATHSGLLRVSDSATDPNGIDRVLFSHPTSLSGRSNLAVQVSYDSTATFTSGVVVVPGPAQYSNMAVTPDGTILLAYRTTIAGLQVIRVARTDLEYLTAGQDSIQGGPDIVVDDLDTEYSEVGSWAEGTQPGAYRFGTAYRYDGSSAADPGAVATFAPDLPLAGTYRVSLVWARGSSRPDAVPVTVTTGGGAGSTTVTVDQRVGGSSWTSIGDFALEPGDVVSVSGADAGFTMTDAVRFEYVGP